MVPSHREGRELQDKDHRSRTQEETTQRPQASLEPRGGNNSRNLEPGSLQEATGKESNLDPPTQGTIQMVFVSCPEKERQPEPAEDKEAANTKEQ